MKKSLISKLIFALVVVAMLFGTVATMLMKVPAKAADTGGYPWADATQLDPNVLLYDWGYGKCPSNDNGCYNLPYPNSKNPTAGMADPWGYGLRNCTSYAAWEINQVFHISVPSNLGNASTWASMAQSDHFGIVHSSSGYTPQVGDIAQWNSPSPWGHVAYVYAVNNGIASLAEYNSGLPRASNGSLQWGLFYSGRTTASNSAGTPDHYIHIGTVNSPPPSAWPGVGSATFLGSDHLNPGQTMHSSQYILSGNVQYALIMQSDGNLVEYSGASALWASNTGGNPGAYLGVQGDGNIVIYNASGQAKWATNTNGQSLAYLVMQSDGNLVAYNTSISPIWANNKGGHPTSTYFGSDRLYNGNRLTSGSYIRSSDLRYAVLMQADGNLVLFGPGYHVLWANGENGNPGAYIGLQSDGNIVEYSSSGQPLWASNTNGKSLNYLVIQTDGNLVAYNTSGAAIWATGTDGKI